MRPRQWVKNGFVLMGVLFANVWRDPLMLRRALLVFVAFSLVASRVYIINDFLDREDGLNHPRQRFRPLASKAISVSAAFSLMIILWLGGLLLGIIVSHHNPLIL